MTSSTEKPYRAHKHTVSGIYCAGSAKRSRDQESSLPLRPYVGAGLPDCDSKLSGEKAFMQLLIQPGDSVEPLIRGIDSAEKSIEIVIFRLDRAEIERALTNAVSRGVYVYALIAHTNRNGEGHLRELETRLLAAGVTVARTNDNLVRYHAKFMIVDRRILYLLGFNFTYLDMEQSRSFGLIIKNRKVVQEAARLFEADVRRQPYAPGPSTLLVSPLNARKQLVSFLNAAKKELLIYDLKISDPEMIELLRKRAKAGANVKVLGRVTRPKVEFNVLKLAHMRLHARAIVRDRRRAFVGSQSLREVELDARREVGIIIRNPKIVTRLIKIFEEDWAAAEENQMGGALDETPPLGKAAKKAAKAVAKVLPPVAPVVKAAVEEVVGEKTAVDLDSREVEAKVKDAVKQAVKEAVKDVVEDVFEQNGSKERKQS